MSEENRRKMYEEIKDDPVRLAASGLAAEFEPKVEEAPKAKPKRKK